jgi:hypothetical protein
MGAPRVVVAVNYYVFREYCYRRNLSSTKAMFVPAAAKGSDMHRLFGFAPGTEVIVVDGVELSQDLKDNIKVRNYKIVHEVSYD